MTKWLRHFFLLAALVLAFSAGVAMAQSATTHPTAATQPVGPDNADLQRGLQAFEQKNYQQAMIWFQKAAGLGNSKAMFNIGRLYDAGWGVAQDTQQALAWFRKAAIAGEPIAMLIMGDFYAKGSVFVGNFRIAMAWYQKAAALGDSDAMFNIGNLYQHGFGVPQDNAKAITWFQKAAQLGNQDAQNALAKLLPQ